jgi:hypothetical protein
MKPIKVTLWIVALVCLAASCKKEPVTYRFAEEDKLKLLPHYIEGKIFTFVNENGDEKGFKVSSIINHMARLIMPNGMYVADDEYYFYEEKRIFLIDLLSQKTFRITLRRLPIDGEKARSDIYKNFPSHLCGLICDNFYNYSVDIIYKDEQNSMKINETYFYNVINLNVNTQIYSGTLKDACIIYYDIYQGLIGFDDINNHQWRLKNSK